MLASVYSLVRRQFARNLVYQSLQASVLSYLPGRKIFPFPRQPDGTIFKLWIDAWHIETLRYPGRGLGERQPEVNLVNQILWFVFPAQRWRSRPMPSRTRPRSSRPPLKIPTDSRSNPSSAKETSQWCHVFKKQFVRFCV